MPNCVKCGRTLPENQLKPLPLLLRIALFPLVGKYSQPDDELWGRYCPICRRVYSILLVIVGIVVAAVLLFISVMWQR